MPLMQPDPANPDTFEDHATRALRKCDEDMQIERAANDPGTWTPPKAGAPATLVTGSGHPIFLRLLREMESLHQHKSGGYGTGSDPFANFTGIASISGRQRCEYPVERIIEKCTRARSLIDQGRWSEVGEEFVDIAGLALCAEAMRREDLVPGD